MRVFRGREGEGSGNGLRRRTGSWGGPQPAARLPSDASPAAKLMQTVQQRARKCADGEAERMRGRTDGSMTGVLA